MTPAVREIQGAALPEYIVVDLDGTLVRTDTFVVTLIEATRKSPLNLFRLVRALLNGRPACKQLAASIAHLDPSILPYNEELLTYLRAQRFAGRKLILATGADVTVARSVSQYLQIFDLVLSTESDANLVGKTKLLAIRHCLGAARFSYAGNSRDDMAIWRSSEASIIVEAPRSSLRKLCATGTAIEKHIVAPPLSVPTIVRSLRVHQWTKNILVLLPLILSHRILHVRDFPLTIWAAFGLSLLASALYLVNDVMDAQADRLHPRKRFRPIAAGVMTIRHACMLALSLLVAAAGVGLALPVPARLLLCGYAVAVLIYSTWLKRLLFLDVVSLAVFYTIRVLYGGAATAIPISVWTLACSLFLFTSLAAIKRLTELRRTTSCAGMTEYRGYQETDVVTLAYLASAAGYVSVLVFALYIDSSEVVVLYSHPQRLWLLCPLMIYWLGRLCLLANRGSLDDDPVSFALRDRATWLIGGICALIVFLSTR